MARLLCCIVARLLCITMARVLCLVNQKIRKSSAVISKYVFGCRRYLGNKFTDYAVRAQLRGLCVSEGLTDGY